MSHVHVVLCNDCGHRLVLGDAPSEHVADDMPKDWDGKGDDPRAEMFARRKPQDYADVRTLEPAAYEKTVPTQDYVNPPDNISSRVTTPRVRPTKAAMSDENMPSDEAAGDTAYVDAPETVSEPANE